MVHLFNLTADKVAEKQDDDDAVACPTLCMHWCVTNQDYFSITNFVLICVGCRQANTAKI
mgnify:FL=1